MGSVCFSNALNTHCAINPRDYTQQHTLSSAVSSRHSYFFSFSRGKIRPHTDITLTYLLFPRSPPYISSLLSLAYIWSHQAWIDKPFFSRMHTACPPMLLQPHTTTTTISTTPRSSPLTKAWITFDRDPIAALTTYNTSASSRYEHTFTLKHTG